MACLLGPFFIGITMLFFCGWLGCGLSNAKATGNMSVFWVAVVIGVLGTMLLFFARLPLDRQGRFLSFGPRELDEKHRKIYWWAYGFIGASIYLLIELLVFVR
jgi:hypothetical protein